MLKRLQSEPSAYNVWKWEEDFKEKEELMRNVICEYPYILGGGEGSNSARVSLPGVRSSISSANSLR